MSYVVELTTTASRELHLIPMHGLLKFKQVIDNMLNNPRPRGCKKLAGAFGLWRIRIGDYRIIYEINDHQKKIIIRRVLHRKEAYR